MNVLIAEDDALHRAFLKSVVVNALPECSLVIEAEDGLTAIQAMQSEQVNGVIMDLQMPGANGVDAAKQIWHEFPDMRILFWSNYADEATSAVSRVSYPAALSTDIC